MLIPLLPVSTRKPLRGALAGRATYAVGGKGQPLHPKIQGFWDKIPNAICKDACLAKTSRTVAFGATRSKGISI